MIALIKIPLSRNGTVLVLGGICLFLVATHAIAMIAWYKDWFPDLDWWVFSYFDLDEEESLGTWFSAMILFFAGQLCVQELINDARPPAPPFRYYWILLALGFHLMSLDEIAGFHEGLNTALEDTHWTTYGLVLVGILGLSFIPFLRWLSTRTAVLFGIAGAVYILGVIGVERATTWHEERDLLDTLPYNLWNAVEEGLEMAGIILFIYAMLDRIADRHAAD